jgi:hypothetical protein
MRTTPEKKGQSRIKIKKRGFRFAEWDRAWADKRSSALSPPRQVTSVVLTVDNRAQVERLE